MSHFFGCKQTPPTPPTTSDEESDGSTSDDEMKKKKGNRAMGKKKYPKAKKYYSKAIKIDPNNPTYRLNRAIANAALELWKDAEADAASAVELGNPPTTKAHFQLAKACLKQARLDEAKEALKVGLEAYPSEAVLLQLSKEVERACTIREAKRKKEEEAKANAPATSSGPASARALLDQAREAYSAGRLEDALKLLSGARDANKAGSGQEATKAMINIAALQGKTAMRQRRWPEAVEFLQEVVALEEGSRTTSTPEDKEALSNAYNNLGIACKNAGRMKDATNYLNQGYLKATDGDLAVATPQVGQIVQNLAQCLAQQEKFDEAVDMYSRALAIGNRLYGPDHASHSLNHMGIARCLKREGKLPEAIKAYTAAYELWTKRDPEVCIREMPEVPSKERFCQLQEQCRQELAQLVMFAEEIKRRREAGEPISDDAGAAAVGAAVAEAAGSAE